MVCSFKDLTVTLLIINSWAPHQPFLSHAYSMISAGKLNRVPQELITPSLERKKMVRSKEHLINAQNAEELGT